MVFFSGENIPGALDNSRAGDYCNCSRNVGFVKVSKNLGPEDSCILSQGAVERGGFFSINGEWTDLVNRGIKWLTKFNGE